MKKVLGLLAIVGFVACSNGENAASTVDSAKYKDSVMKAEEAAKAAAQAPTTATIDSAKYKDSMMKAAEAAKTAMPAKTEEKKEEKKH